MARLALRWRRVSQFHEDERLVALAATWPGRLVVLVCAAYLLVDLRAPEVSVVAMAATTLLPTERRPILGVCALVYLLLAVHGVLPAAGYETPGVIAWLWAVVAGGILLGVSHACFTLARGFAAWPRVVRRAPLVFLHLAFLLLLVVVGNLPKDWPQGPLPLLLTTLLPFLVWRCSFLFLSGKRGTVKDTRFHDHLLYLWPSFGGTNVPYGKGHDYLSQHEAKTAEALAGSQLAGLKLLWLAWLWTYAQRALSALVYGDLPGRIRELAGGWSADVPRLARAIPDAELSLPMAWAAIYVDLLRAVLWIAILGHVVIGVLRMCGFRVFRNTYKPLLAETLLDFWNRYYYYFKELLVELFFFPTYLRWFKTRPRLRLFTATFAAAFVGNAYYHVLRQGGDLARGDVAALWEHQGPRLVYCFLLALGIYVSMSRQQARRGQVARAARWRRALAIFGVWTFFALIHVWNTPGEDVGWADRVGFLLGLVGLRGVFF